MQRPEKLRAVEEIRNQFAKMSSAVFLDYTGMTVEQVSKLRDAFRQKGVVYRVVKNTLVKKALDGMPWASKLGATLNGMTGIAWSFEEPSAAARAVKEFRVEAQKPAIKGGVLEGIVFDARGVEDQLATLPNKDEARARLLATMMAPAQTLVRLLTMPAQNLAGVLAAKQRKEEGGA